MTAVRLVLDIDVPPSLSALQLRENLAATVERLQGSLQDIWLEPRQPGYRPAPARQEAAK